VIKNHYLDLNKVLKIIAYHKEYNKRDQSSPRKTEEFIKPVSMAEKLNRTGSLKILKQATSMTSPAKLKVKPKLKLKCKGKGGTKEHLKNIFKVYSSIKKEMKEAVMFQTPEAFIGQYLL